MNRKSNLKLAEPHRAPRMAVDRNALELADQVVARHMEPPVSIDSITDFSDDELDELRAAIDPRFPKLRAEAAAGNVGSQQELHLGIEPMAYLYLGLAVGRRMS